MGRTATYLKLIIGAFHLHSGRKFLVLWSLSTYGLNYLSVQNLAICALGLFELQINIQVAGTIFRRRLVVIKLVSEHFKLTFLWNTSAVNYQQRENQSLNGTFGSHRGYAPYSGDRCMSCVWGPYARGGGTAGCGVGRKGQRRG